MAAAAPGGAAAGDFAELAELMRALDVASKEKRRGGFSVKKTTFQVKSSRDSLKVDSWRLKDWDYKRADLPTYARGLFTTKTRDGPEIAVRGYDKFFNVGEVGETKWDNIIAKTQPPYELTLKENGCIIFIAGLEDETLLVCSKHSTGDRADVNLSHASAGERRLEQQLAALGKTKADLARELRRRGVTAVAELCDDSFEEHILAYGPEKAGLYLHGVNLNRPTFATYPSSAVQEFAGQWGFRKTGVIVMDDVHQVKAFLEETAETGAHDGRDVEGFVVRCKMRADADTRPGQDWFFKFKFEEPYLMYRQWRECTKSLIAGKQAKFKKHVKITGEYLAYARKRLAADPALGKLYNQNHGIIGLRDDFLKFKNMKGSDAANMDESEPLVMADVVGNVILCPIATIGCGKTTIALALTKLFGWGHVQNDNITGKGRPPRFTAAVFEELQKQPVAFADRNNAWRHERGQLIDDVKAQSPTAKLVCLNFRHDEDSMDEIRRITRERVLARGDNHQTIHAATDGQKFLGVMESFISRFEPCNPYARPDDGFDAVIDLDPTAGSRKNVEVVITRLHKHFPNLVKQMPSPAQLDAAIEEAMVYKPSLRHDIPSRANGQRREQKQAPKPQKRKSLEYMSVEVATETVKAALDEAFGRVDAETARFYEQLKETGRVQDRFHVTLMHRATAGQHPELWRRYTQLYEAASGTDDRIGSCDLILERVVFDDRVMAIVVRLADDEGKWECVNRVAHITVGTRDASVKPKESNDLLGRWLDDGLADGEMREVLFEHKPKARGDVKGVLSR
ncbi:hypothetical protein CDD83_9101 [Cordyceps sp. RAO-2017]|nr:hypothetical protein CDD83_9101 [Cordyceps sp. RAO-2017]